MRVMKFGGVTVASPQHILNVAQIIAQHVLSGEKVIVVVSAMGKSTSELLKLAQQVSPHPHRRELDMLLSVGERITMSLLSMALNDLKIPAVSLTGSQAGILTNEDHENAEVIEVRPQRIEAALNEGKTVIVAGFQGVSARTKEITTLGRGGSDTTAIALAGYFKCRCDILKEMAAIYSADPKIFHQAQKLEEIDYETLEVMTHWGAKMLNSRAATRAKQQNVDLFFSEARLGEHTGTRVVSRGKLQAPLPKVLINQHPVIARIQTSLWRKLEEEAAQLELKRKFSEFNLPEPQILWMKRGSLEDEFFLSENTDTFNILCHIFLSKENQLKIDQHQWVSFSVISEEVTKSALFETLRNSGFTYLLQLKLPQRFLTVVFTLANEQEKLLEILMTEIRDSFSTHS